MEHEIRTKSGSKVMIKNLTRSMAIKLQCTECLGFGEAHPKECTDKLCPLFPYRGKCQAGYDQAADLDSTQPQPLNPAKLQRKYSEAHLEALRVGREAYWAKKNSKKANQ
jgi:hypothetical protein